MTTTSPDAAMIFQALTLLRATGAVAELRVLHTGRTGTVSGYYNDLDAMAKAAAKWSGKAPGVYVTLNPCTPALLARSANHLTAHAQQTTSDSDIVQRCWFPVDFDPVRPAGISSTDAEHDAAVQRARQCYAWLKQRGWPAPLAADSGNGAHLLYRIDLPNDSASRDLLRRCLEAVALYHGDDVVGVDLTTFNAARIWKIYGTLACKGDSLPERPHRLARLLDVPMPLEVVSRAQLEALAALVPAPPQAVPRSKYNGHVSFDLDQWIVDHGLPVISRGTWGSGGSRWVLNPCPWNSSHTNKSAFIVQLPTGAIAAGCHHNGCAENDWHALRDLYAPSWHASRDNPPQSPVNGPTTPSAASAPGQGSAPTTSFVLIPLSDLLNEPEEAVEWLVDGLLPESGFSLLVAKPKVGKSTLARNLALHVAQGQNFLGRKTQQGPVIYLALEEKRAEVRKHFRDMGATGTEEHIHLYMASAPADGLQQVRTAAERLKPVLIIIDPLFRLTRVKDSNDYAQVTQALEPLLVLARETRAHVLCVHHAGKGNREGGDSILGSTAIFGAVDTALMMKKTEQYRTLQSQQRYGDDLEETVLHYDPTTRTVTLGETKHQEDLTRIKQAMLTCLRAQEDDQDNGAPLTAAQLNEDVEGKTALKRTALRELVEGQQIERMGRGGKGAPYQYAVKNSRFLVPAINGEQGNKHPKMAADPQKSLLDACSHDLQKSVNGGNKHFEPGTSMSPLTPQETSTIPEEIF